MTAAGVADQVLQLGDGRTLGFKVYGDPAGAPLLFLHGTPGSRLKFAIGHAAGKALGLAIVAPDRWGYGLSDAPARADAAGVRGRHGGADGSSGPRALRRRRHLGRWALCGWSCRVPGAAGGGAGSRQSHGPGGRSGDAGGRCRTSIASASAPCRARRGRLRWCSRCSAPAWSARRVWPRVWRRYVRVRATRRCSRAPTSPTGCSVVSVKASGAAWMARCWTCSCSHATGVSTSGPSARRRVCGSAPPTLRCRWARLGCWRARSPHAPSRSCAATGISGWPRATARCWRGLPQRCGPVPKPERLAREPTGTDALSPR